MTYRCPALCSSAIPHQGRRRLPEAQYKTVDAVVGQIGHKRASLLSGRSWRRQIACGAGKVLPAQFLCVSRKHNRHQRSDNEFGEIVSFHLLRQ